jgi:hypothetical protein
VYSQELHDKALFENSLMDKSYFHTQVEYSGASWVKKYSGKTSRFRCNFFYTGQCAGTSVCFFRLKANGQQQFNIINLEGFDDF